MNGPFKPALWFLCLLVLCLFIPRTANFDDPLAKERDAPPEPLPIQFPAFTPALKTSPLTVQKHVELKRLLMGIKIPSDIATRHVEAFNVKYQANVTVSGLIPDLPDGLIEESTFNTLVKEEFTLENDLCFRKVCRLPPEKGQTLPRLAHTYLFFKNLEDMSRYWDNSKDKYFEGVLEAELANKNDVTSKSSVQKENIKSATDANGDTHMEDSTNDKRSSIQPQIKKLYTGRRFGNASTMPPHMRDATLEGLLRITSQRLNTNCKPPPPLYTRLQIGELLIPVRQTLVIGQLPADRAEARRQKTVGSMLVGSARAEITFRKEGEQLGKGQGEVTDFLRELGGLLLLAQQRNRDGKMETKPGASEECWWAKKERWGGGKGGKMPHEEVENPSESLKTGEDVVVKDHSDGHARAKRSLELLAGRDPATSSAPLTDAVLEKTSSTRDAAREAAANAAISNGKTMENAGSSSINKTLPSPSPMTNLSAALSAVNARPERPPMSARRIAAMCNGWKALRPPSALWDPNLTYRAIGKIDGVDGEWDDVFMMSCVNTHVSLLRMRVSKGYINWLESGTMSEVSTTRKWGRSGIVLPAMEREARDWDGEIMQREVLYIQRSVWWDLFEPEQRVEALRAMWMCLSWIGREVERGRTPMGFE